MGVIHESMFIPTRVGNTQNVSAVIPAVYCLIFAQLAECGPRNPGRERQLRSYRHCFGQNTIPEGLRQSFGCQDIDRYTQEPLQLVLNARDVEQRSVRSRINQQVEIAAIAVIPGCRGPENPGIAHAVLHRDAADFVAMRA